MSAPGPYPTCLYDGEVERGHEGSAGFSGCTVLGASFQGLCDLKGPRTQMIGFKGKIL